MKLNNLEEAKRELQNRGLNLPEKIEERDLNEKEATVFDWYVVIDTTIIGGRSARTQHHIRLQSFDERRKVKAPVKAILESGDAILIHDKNKKPATKTSTRGKGKNVESKNDE